MPQQELYAIVKCPGRPRTERKYRATHNTWVSRRFLRGKFQRNLPEIRQAHAATSSLRSKALLAVLPQREQDRNRNFLPYIALSLFWLGLGLALLSPVATAPVLAAPKKEGDILKIFERGRIYIVTNEDASVADQLLAGANYRERRVLSLEEWKNTPPDVRRFVTIVYLINRQKLSETVQMPEKCLATADELALEVMRTVYQSSTNYEITLSAPDAAWLRHGIAEFRRLKEAPRQPQKRYVQSLAVIPTSAAASAAAAPILVNSTDSLRAHILFAEQYTTCAARSVNMNELVLIDRNATPCATFAPVQEELLRGHRIGRGETVAWREQKPNGRFRAVITAPTADQLAEAIRRNPDPRKFPEVATVLNKARDLRDVRRVAVVGVKNGVVDAEMARRLASRAATELRGLDAFEVLERAGLSEVLAEVALGQAGITKAGDRAKVQQMAAADALLLVEVNDINGRTDYKTRHKRLTPWMAGPPARPQAPTRLRFNITITDPNVRTVAENLLKKVGGTKSEETYDRELAYYHREALPAWQREVELYYNERRKRTVSWEQMTIAASTVSVSGSLRLVDLNDGLVLWEAPFTASEAGEGKERVTTLTTVGEESRPGPTDVPAPSGNVPEILIARATDTGLMQGFQTLRGTALLPGASTMASLSAKETEQRPSTPLGRLLDVDGDTVLIGLGTLDNVNKGDALLITLPDGSTIRVIVTRARPRTCDTTFAATTTASQRSQVSIGLSATIEP